MNENYNKLTLKYFGINTYKEPIVYIHKDCTICKSEGLEAPARVQVTLNDRSIIATLNTIQTNMLQTCEAGLSDYAWDFLSAREGDQITITHPKPLESLRYIRSKIYGNELNFNEMSAIIQDIVSGNLSDLHIAMFIAATTGDRTSQDEIIHLTKAMVNVGQKITWGSDFIVDKHSVGGLPGNRTTPIVVSIVAAYGLKIPKTSSRAITSPSGTADTMEVLTPVNLNLQDIKKVVEKENGCIVWGGAVSLSPADDLLIRIERTANLNSEVQLVASILSKKVSAGVSHLVIDMPIGTTAKVASLQRAEILKKTFEHTAKAFNLKIKIIFTDGSQPLGRGIGPALEAEDVVSVLTGNKNAPHDLRERALLLAGHVLEMSSAVPAGQGLNLAKEILDSGKAWQKFQAICHAQGGMRDIPKAQYSHTIEAKKSGILINIDNHRIANVAKLSGAPRAKAAGVILLNRLNAVVEKQQPLFTVCAETKSELDYALNFVEQNQEIFQIEESQ